MSSEALSSQRKKWDYVGMEHRYQAPRYSFSEIVDSLLNASLVRSTRLHLVIVTKAPASAQIRGTVKAQGKGSQKAQPFGNGTGKHVFVERQGFQASTDGGTSRSTVCGWVVFRCQD